MTASKKQASKKQASKKPLNVRYGKYLAKSTAYREEQKLLEKIPPEVEAKLAAEKMVELYNSALREIEALELVIRKYRNLFPHFTPINGGVYMQASKYLGIREFDKGWIPVPKFEKAKRLSLKSIKNG